MIRLLAFCILVLPLRLGAEEAEPPMTIERMTQIVLALDPGAALGGAGFELTIDDVPVVIVTDINANRMRAMVPIRGVDGLTFDEMQRLMQANFDSALDARYAIAQGRLWGVFIHPFAELERDQLISGIAQTVNIARSYGTLYSSGVGQFGAGDSGRLQQRLIEDLLERGQDI